MDEAEPPKRNFWTRKMAIVAVVAAAIAAAGGFFAFSSGSGYVFAAWHAAGSLAAKTFHDVLGGGGSGTAMDIDITSSTDAAPEEEGSSTLFAADPPVDDPGASAPVSDSGGSQASAIDGPQANASGGGAEMIAPPTPPPSRSPAPTAATVTSSQKNAGTVPAVPCGFAATNEPTHKILFNEIAWMGSLPAPGETAAQAGNREWIELRNNSGARADLSGWQIADDSGKLKITFDPGMHLDFGNFFLLERSDDGSVTGAAADKIYSGTLANTGDWLRLFDGDCRLIDEIDASSSWPGGDNATKATLERDLMDFDWHTSGYPGGTPKAQNSVVWNGGSVSAATPPPPPASPDAVPTSTIIDATSTPPDPQPAPPKPSPPPAPPPANSPAHLVIAVVQTGGGASTNDLLKLFNPGSAPVDISGWKLRKRTATGTETSLRVLPAGSAVQPQGYFTWANSANGLASSIAADASSSETLASGNSIAVEDASGTIIDALAWGSGAVNPFVEGTAFPTDPTAGQMLSRKFTGSAVQDTDNNADDFEIK